MLVFLGGHRGVVLRGASLQLRLRVRCNRIHTEKEWLFSSHGVLQELYRPLGNQVGRVLSRIERVVPAVQRRRGVVVNISVWV